MSSSFLEIIELSNGDVALKRVDDDEALVKITFSPTAKHFLQDEKLNVAKAMINAGMYTASRLTEGQAEEVAGTLH